MHQFLPSLLAGFKNLVVSLAHFSPLIGNPLEIPVLHSSFIFTGQRLCSLLKAQG